LVEAQTSVTDSAVSRSQQKNEIDAAVREQTLGDRIVESMLSRLQQMCMTVSMQGDDFRRPVQRTSFSISRKTSEQQTDVKVDEVMGDFLRRQSSNIRS